jgi:hypothetical protein
MQLSEERGGITPKSKALTLEQQRIQELEALCERLERGNCQTICRLCSISKLRPPWQPAPLFAPGLR